MGSPPQLKLLTSPGWQAYELIDSGNGRKLERYGPVVLDRPEPQAFWKPALEAETWNLAHAVFHPTGGESGGEWEYRRSTPRAWDMEYKGLRFNAFTGGSRLTGVFPEQACQWDWIEETIQSAHRPTRVLNLFGYTGLATLAAARAGASVTHVDASKKSVSQARHNQQKSGLIERPIRWLVDDADKFVQRELRRGNKYDGFILDPPKFGRGPQGQVWELFESLTALLENCRALLSNKPLFLVLTAYAIRASSLSIYYLVQDIFTSLNGAFEAGELALVERSAGRMLSTAIYTRWSAED